MSSGERDELSSRHGPPAHYVAEINSVTELLKLRKHKFGPFEVGGYNWKLELEPRGHTTQERKEYMSLYLVIDEPNKLGRGERILVDYKFFVLNNNDKTYVIFKEKGKELRAFSRGITRRGLLKFLSLDSFNDPKNGYRDRDSCTIGAELLVSKPTRKKATLTIKNPSPNEITLNIQRFSTSKSSVQSSEAFPLEGRDWKLKLRPQRNEKGKRLSVHLEAQFISPGKLLFVKAMLRVVNTDPKKNKEREVSGWLDANKRTFGEPSFMSWSNLEQQKGGFIHKNELPFAVKILTIFEVRKTNESV